ncbi:MAG: hypothetical protein WBL05_12990 [Brooklawnia sp.]|uniref:hypothetical protein n=1 Tax=Brooklawnia sp. TaxID=2699740 RepID=UPI003C788E91
MQTADRVRGATDSGVNRRLDQERLSRVTALVGASPEVISQHIRELDHSWDVERVLELNASSLMLLSLALSRLHTRKWLVLSTAVPAFLLQHAIQGWCPPIWVIRRLGVRTRREIDVERTALKALRGDFSDFVADGVDAAAAARAAIERADRQG